MLIWANSEIKAVEWFIQLALIGANKSIGGANKIIKKGEERVAVINSKGLIELPVTGESG
jgi:hypothetical protein